MAKRHAHIKKRKMNINKMIILVRRVNEVPDTFAVLCWIGLFAPAVFIPGNPGAGAQAGTTFSGMAGAPDSVKRETTCFAAPV